MPVPPHQRAHGNLTPRHSSARRSPHRAQPGYSIVGRDPRTLTAPPRPDRHVPRFRKGPRRGRRRVWLRKGADRDHGALRFQGANSTHSTCLFQRTDTRATHGPDRTEPFRSRREAVPRPWPAPPGAQGTELHVERHRTGQAEHRASPGAGGQCSLTRQRGRRVGLCSAPVAAAHPEPAPELLGAEPESKSEPE